MLTNILMVVMSFSFTHFCWSQESHQLINSSQNSQDQSQPKQINSNKPMTSNPYEEEITEEEAEKLLDDSSVDLFADDKTSEENAQTKDENNILKKVEDQTTNSKTFKNAPAPRKGETIQGSAPIYPYKK